VIGIDSNVLVRELTGDEPAQAASAAVFMDSLTAADPGFVSLVVVLETVWTLKRSYGLAPERIATCIRTLLDAREVVVQASAVVRRALQDSEEYGADFSDAIIAHLGIDADCDYTVTFDKRAAALPGMRLLE
jgi:predicted nucleic-acid-binding protein